jgi:hypothetical protein
MIPARSVERLSKDCLIRRGQRRQDVFHRFRTEAIRQELKTGLENTPFDFHRISLAKRSGEQLAVGFLTRG